MPRRLAAVVLGAMALLSGVLATTTALGSPDDLGRQGRWLFRQCSDVMSEPRGPWPGSIHSAAAGLLVVVPLVGAATSAGIGLGGRACRVAPGWGHPGGRAGATLQIRDPGVRGSAGE